MGGDWDDLGHGPWPDTAQVPHQAPDDATRARRHLPKTLLPVPGDGVVQPPVFDPSLKHLVRAMRAGEPRFADPRQGERWYAARRTAIDQILAAIVGSEWAGHLALRGSMLLKAWFGDAAREPGDLDFVVVPRSWRMGDDRTSRMFRDIARQAEWLGADVQVHAQGAVTEGIWTYDRVPGQRLVLPWTADGLPPGTVQLDFVFNERLPAAPEPTPIPRSDGGAPALVGAATPELSLAWKLVWLISDMYPQGKDLYDAVLLAESTPLRNRLLREALVVADSRYARQAATSLPLSTPDVDWFELCKEYPHIQGSAQDYLDRLTTALAPTFAEPYEHPGSAYERAVRWLDWRISDSRDLLAQEGLDAVLRDLAGQQTHTVDAIIIVRELLGPATRTLDDATATLLRSHDWRGSARYYGRYPHRLAEELDPLR